MQGNDTRLSVLASREDPDQSLQPCDCDPAPPHRCEEPSGCSQQRSGKFQTKIAAVLHRRIMKCAAAVG